MSPKEKTEKLRLKEFDLCVPALDFIDDLKKKKLTGNLHSRLHKGGYIFSVSWKITKNTA